MALRVVDQSEPLGRLGIERRGTPLLREDIPPVIVELTVDRVVAAVRVAILLIGFVAFDQLDPDPGIVTPELLPRASGKDGNRMYACKIFF